MFHRQLPYCSRVGGGADLYATVPNAEPRPVNGSIDSVSASSVPAASVDGLVPASFANPKSSTLVPRYQAYLRHRRK